MKRYQLAYDLKQKPEFVYDRLISALKEAGARHAQLSVWFIDSNQTGDQVYRRFAQYIGRDDSLLVTEVVPANSCATRNSEAWRALANVPAPALAGRQAAPKPVPAPKPVHLFDTPLLGSFGNLPLNPNPLYTPRTARLGSSLLDDILGFPRRPL